MKLTVLGSGSTGNAILIVAGNTRVLVDAGLSAKELTKRFALMGEDIQRLDGILVTLANAINVSVRNGSVRSWGGNGINLLDAATSATNVSEIVATQNVGGGIKMGFGGTITRCTCYNNTGFGIAGAAGTVITECASNTNGSHGITTGSGCTISRNTVRSNVGDGINVFGSCLVLNNACSLNGNGAGGTWPVEPSR